MDHAPPATRAALACCGVLGCLACGDALTPPRGPVHRLSVSPESTTVTAGDSVHFTVVARNSGQGVLANPALTWTSSDTTVARVRPDGTALGVAPGAALIAVGADLARDTARLLVVARVEGLRIVPAGATLVPGGQYPLAAYSVAADGAVIRGVDAQWVSSDTAAVRIAATGTATGVAAGRAVVRAAAGAFGDSAVVRVLRPAYAGVSAGPSKNTCAAGPDGAFCWGVEEYFGSLGTGAALAGLAAPVGVAGAVALTAVSAGEGFACGLASDGRAYCWGHAAYGRLGSAVADSVVPAPVAVSGTLRLRALSAGRRHACGVTATGDVWCWGGNSTGALGISPATETSAVPVHVEVAAPVETVGAGFLHSCGLTTDGEVLCWGRGFQLGDSAGVTRPTPAPIHGGRRYRALSVGWTHSCALTADSTAYCWGFNFSGECGSSVGGTVPLVPVPVEGAPRLASISAGYSTTCGLTAAGEAWCWGANVGGFLGTGDTLSLPTPRRVAAGFRFAVLSVGQQHVCGLGLDGVLYCWGSAEGGMLGDGATAGVRTTPAPVLGQRTATRRTSPR
jgi:alpha-tubulin suppressor-like RCC1 family protein